MTMLFLSRATATFAIFFIFLRVQINAFYKYSVKEKRCMALAKKLTAEESNKNDVAFFKLCFADYFGFRVGTNQVTLIPRIHRTFFSQHGKRHNYMNVVMERVERFFIRNGNWLKLLGNRRIFNPISRTCRDMLYIVTVKYIYALYVLNSLRDQVRCQQCIRSRKNHYTLPSRRGVCFIKPNSFTCAQELEFMLLGHKSGTLTTLFNQYFREPIGEDRTVPGFKEDSDILMGVRISAFHLEYTGYNRMFKSYDYHHNQMLYYASQEMKDSTNMKILSLVVAIFRMKSYNKKYFNELLSDQSPLRARTQLAQAFQRWSVATTSFEAKIKSFMESPHYNYELNYRRRNNIAFELVTGKLENSGLPRSSISYLAENAMSLIYNTPVYLAPGAVRHSVINQQFTFTASKTSIDDYWQSMLENWAGANRMYKRCVKNEMKIQECLLQMCKSLYLMFEAMCKIRPLLKKMYRRGKGEKLEKFEDVLAITRNWVLNYRNKGYIALPKKSFFIREKSVQHKMTSSDDFIPADEEEPLDDFQWSDLEESFPDPVKQSLGKDSVDDKGDDEDAHNDNLLTNNIEGSHKTQQLDENIEESAGSQENIEKEKIDDIHMTNSPGFLDLAATEELRDVRKFVTPSKIIPIYVDLDGTAASPGKRSLQKENVDKPLDEDKRTAGPTIVEPDNNEYINDVIAPMMKPSMKQPLDGRTKESVGSKMTKALEENREESVSSSMKESLDNESPMTEPQHQDVKGTAGPPMEEPLDSNIQETAGSQIEKPLTNEIKKTADSQIENPPQDDFVEHEGPPPTPRKKPSNKSAQLHPRYIYRYSTFRRRRYTYRVVPRVHRVYVTSRRRRNVYSRRRRTRPIGRKHPIRRPEMENVKAFLRKFNCHVGDKVWRRTLTQGCMDKIQRRVRKYNRVAFSYATERYKNIVPRQRKFSRKRPRQDVLSKTEL